MQGAGEPTLLFDGNFDQTAALDPFQKSHVITADLMVWVGSGLETSLDQTLNDFPAQRSRLLTLSQLLPLLSRSGANGNLDIPRQQSRDLAFWTDPRLAIMAVRIITPRLVRPDPDNLEVYLDNEIALIQKLKNLEAEITAEFSPFAVNPQILLVNNDSYFINRFIASTAILAAEQYSFRKVFVNGSMACSTPFQREKLSAGPELCFDAMRLKVREIKACIKKKDNNMASSHHEDLLVHGGS
jgi:ABC-type Zn uptake system ZnuABC Zn-binding protein ZnuA